MRIGEIQKGLSVPPKPENASFGATPKYPFDAMEPGDSIPVTPDIAIAQNVTLPDGLVQQIPGDSDADVKKKVKALYVNVCSAVKRYAGKAENAAKRFEVRKFADGVRVWRVVDVPADVPVVVDTLPVSPSYVPPPPGAPVAVDPPAKKGGKK